MPTPDGSGRWVKSKNPAGQPAVKRDKRTGVPLRSLSALLVIWEHQQVASYSAGRDIEAKLISEPSTGTKLDIAANDQIRPIATTTAIATIHARICIPSTSR